MHLKHDRENVLESGSYRYVLAQATGYQSTKTISSLIRSCRIPVRAGSFQSIMDRLA